MTEPTASSKSGRSRLGKVVASKYRLDEELGRGGMGAVYRAFHLRVHKTFAIKLLHGEAAEHKSIASRFFLEAQAAGRIGHPGILDVYDVGEAEDGTPFIVMELLRGEALSSILHRPEGPRITVDAACWIAIEVLDILEAAHKAGVIHRDVKPQNVFVVAGKNDTFSVKLLDFGIAKFAEKDKSLVTRSGEIIGSPLYMAPEQAKGELDVDARVDVWSVGAMLFEMLTGAAAHTASTPVAVLAKILTEPAPAPSSKDDRVPKELDAIVQKALTIDRSLRFADAKEMREALSALRTKSGHEGLPDLPRLSLAPVDSGPGGRTPGSITSTVAASDAPASAKTPAVSDVGAGSTEPALGAALTNAEGGRSKNRPVIVALAIGLLAIAAVVPWLVPSWTQRSTSGTTGAPEASSVARTEPPASTSAATSSPAPASASAPAALSLSVSASASAPPPVPPSTVKQPACALGEVLSSGHCCPRGLVWQQGRCERPLATSF